MNYRNLFIGIAIGDAYGAGLEFQDRKWIQQNVDFTKFINKRSEINVPDVSVFTTDYKEWDYTDDTEMSIAVAKAIISKKNFTDDLLVDFFTNEYNLGFDKKGYKRNGHGSIRHVYSGKQTIEEIKEFQRSKQYPGNAPPMRAIPIGFVEEDKINEYATVNATSTHPNPKAIDSSILIARATRAILIDKLDQYELIPHCIQYISDPETILKLKEADKLPSPDKLSEKDYSVLCGPQPLVKPEFIEGLFGLSSNAMYTSICALYLIKHTNSAFEGLKNSINIGGDVDSLASIVVGILAGKYGISDIPIYMLENVEGIDYLSQIAKELEEVI
jgi:ADP-ribosylglycohydrolase